MCWNNGSLLSVGRDITWHGLHSSAFPHITSHPSDICPSIDSTCTSDKRGQRHATGQSNRHCCARDVIGWIYVTVSHDRYLLRSIYLVAIVFSIPRQSLSVLYLKLPIYLWLYSPLSGLGSFFSFFIFYMVGRTLWTGDQPVARPLPTHRTAQTQNKGTQTSMPQVGFEPTIPVFGRAKTVRALERAANVIGFER
jgi:hypothetical protein